MRKLRRALVVPIIAIFLIAGPAASSAIAGKPQAEARGTCAVDPSTVVVGQTWTMTATNVGAGKHLTVAVSDSGGTTYFFAQASSSGSLSVSWHSYYRGTSSVKVTDSSGRKPVVVANCSFQVV